MSKKYEEKIKRSPFFETILLVIITVILAAVISAFTFGMSANISRIPFKMTVFDSEKDRIDVYVSNVTTQEPLAKVQIGIYNYDTDTLLQGPLFTNESGFVSFLKPEGYDNHFRVHGTYNGVYDTKNIDNRPFNVKMDEFLGNFSTPLYAVLLGIFGTIVAYVKRDYFKSVLDKLSKIGKGKDKL